MYFKFLPEINIFIKLFNFRMKRYSVFVLKVPLRTNQSVNQPVIKVQCRHKVPAKSIVYTLLTQASEEQPKIQLFINIYVSLLHCFNTACY